MTKIVVFYDVADLVLARRVATEIDSVGFSSWLADDDTKNDWHAELEELVGSESCGGAVVIWSTASKRNPVVRDEAKQIQKAERPLLSVFLDGLKEAPLGLNDGPRYHLPQNTEGSLDQKLKAKIETVFGKPERQERALQLKGKRLHAPSMVLSVSSFETQFEPDATLDLLSIVNPPAVLVSAYDLLRPKPKSKSSSIKPKITNTSAIDQLRDSGSIVFLDSGNYEAMRLKDPNWKKGKKRLLEAQNVIDVDLAFTHDSFPDEIEEEDISPQRRIDEVTEEYCRDNSLMDCAIAPIVHAPRLSGNRYRHDLLPDICCGVAQAVKPPMLAVAERELGDGLMERVKTISKIRRALDDQGSGAFIHVLGTGNPITMAFLSMAGADFFDGLEWCRTAIDGQRWRLYHFQQWDLFSSQHGLIEAPELAELIKDQTGAVPWITKVALHNIAFFMQASRSIRTHHDNGEYELLFTYKELVNEYRISKDIVEGQR